jgi:hypothetical protein
VTKRSPCGLQLQDLSPRETVSVESGTLEGTDQRVKVVAIKVQLVKTLDHMVRHLGYLRTYHPYLVNALG